MALWQISLSPACRVWLEQLLTVRERMAAELRTEAWQTRKQTYVRSYDQNQQEVTGFLGTQSSGRSLEEGSSSPVWR